MCTHSSIIRFERSTLLSEKDSHKILYILLRIDGCVKLFTFNIFVIFFTINYGDLWSSVVLRLIQGVINKDYSLRFVFHFRRCLSWLSCTLDII